MYCNNCFSGWVHPGRSGSRHPRYVMGKQQMLDSLDAAFVDQSRHDHLPSVVWWLNRQEPRQQQRPQPRPAGSATTTPNLLLPLGPALQWRSRHKWCGPRGQSQSFPIGFQVKAATEATTPDRVCVTAWCSLCASASGGSDVKLEASSANDKV